MCLYLTISGSGLNREDLIHRGFCFPFRNSAAAGESGQRIKGDELCFCAGEFQCGFEVEARTVRVVSTLAALHRDHGPLRIRGRCNNANFTLPICFLFPDFRMIGFWDQLCSCFLLPP